MANQRAPGQTLVGFWADEQFTAKVDKARGVMSRSQWVRNVIAEKLIQEGHKVSYAERSAPDRTGKGGPTRKRLHDSVFQLNEKANSDKPSVAKRLLKQAVASEPPADPK